MLYDNMMAGFPFNLMLKGSLCRPGKSIRLMLVAAEVTGMIWMETIFGRETWLEDLMIVDFGAILSCACQLVLSTIDRDVRDILLWRRKRKGKLSLKSSCLRGELGGVLEGLMTTRMRENRGHRSHCY